MIQVVGRETIDCNCYNYRKPESSDLDSKKGNLWRIKREFISHEEIMETLAMQSQQKRRADRQNNR